MSTKDEKTKAKQIITLSLDEYEIAPRDIVNWFKIHHGLFRYKPSFDNSRLEQIQDTVHTIFLGNKLNKIIDFLEEYQYYAVIEDITSQFEAKRISWKEFRSDGSNTPNQPPSSGASNQPPSSGASNQPPSSGASNQPPSSGASNQPPSAGASSQRSNESSYQPSGTTDSKTVAETKEKEKPKGVSEPPKSEPQRFDDASQSSQPLAANAQSSGADEDQKGGAAGKTIIETEAKEKLACGEIKKKQTMTDIESVIGTKEKDEKPKDQKTSTPSRIVRVGGFGRGDIVEIFHPSDPNIPHITKRLEFIIPVKYHQCQIIDKDKLLIIGGCSNRIRFDVEKYDPFDRTTILNLKTFKSTTGPRLPKPIVAGAAATLNGTVFICGGETANIPENASSSCYKLINNHQEWVEISPMNIARVNLTMSVFNGKLFAVGGLGNQNNRLTSVEFYDPESDVWTELPRSAQLNTARAASASLVYQGKIWITGGRLCKEESISSTEIYDSNTGIWSFGPPLNEKRDYHSMVLFEGKMYVLGGWDWKARIHHKTIEVYNDDEERWEIIDYSLEEPFACGDCVLI